jgi:SAM-dependent methyltransferase
MVVIRDHDRSYWSFQRAVTRRQLLPFLSRAGVAWRGARVVELGCAEGGVALEFALAGAQAQGIDLDAARLAVGRELAAAEGVALELRHGDACDPAVTGGAVDLVVLRDVVEHLPDLEEVLRGLRRVLRPGGALLISFPPFYGPFGLHQQLLRGSPLRWLPWASLLPATWLRRWVGRGPFHQEVLELLRCRLSLRRFARACERSGYRELRRCSYLVRPAHALRFGLPVIPAGPLARVPGLRELVVSGTVVLLRIDSGA